MSRCLWSDNSVQVDDTDPDIVYSGQWDAQVGLSFYAIKMNYNDTMHQSVNAGDTATFKFNGTRAVAWSSLEASSSSGGSNTSYTLDGTVAQISPVSPQPFPRIAAPMFDSGGIPNGEHTLIITNLDGAAFHSFNLDFLLYFPSPGSQTYTSCVQLNDLPGSTLPSSTTATGTGTTSTGAQGSATSVSDRSATATAVVHSSTSLGAAVGGVVAGMLALVFIGLAIGWCVLRRRKAPIPIAPASYPSASGADPRQNSRTSFPALESAFLRNASPRGDIPHVSASAPSAHQTQSSASGDAAAVNPFMTALGEGARSRKNEPQRARFETETEASSAQPTRPVDEAPPSYMSDWDGEPRRI